MNAQSEEKLKVSVRAIHDLQKGSVCERNGVETSEKDGSVIVRFPIEMQSGDIARFTQIIGERFVQLFCEFKPELESRLCIRAAAAANIANQALRFGHISVDSRDGRVFYTISQLMTQADQLPGVLAVALMELEDWFAPMLDLLESPMDRQDLEDFSDAAGRITHMTSDFLAADELYGDEDE